MPPELQHAEAAYLDDEAYWDCVQAGWCGDPLEPDDPATQRPSSWAPVDLATVLDGRDLDEPPALLPRDDGPCLLYAAKVNGFSGEPESCKGWTALRAAADELLAGRHVVYLDFEDSAAGVIPRLQDLSVTDAAILSFFHYIRPDEPLTERGRRDLQGCLALRPSIVSLDGITEAMGLHGLDLRDNAEVARFMELVVRPLTSCGAAVLLIDHVGRDREARGRFAIGAQHKLAAIDGAAYSFDAVRPFARGKDGLVIITVSKDRPGHVRQHADARGRIAEVHLHSDPDGGVSVDLKPPANETSPGDTFRPTVLMERISKLVAANPSGLSGRAIEGAIKGKAAAIRLAQEILVNEGYIRVEDGPRRAQLHVHVRPFPEPGRSE